jgi:lipopolysaccharide transport system ATP-binding protein
MSDDIAISVQGVSKAYRIWNSPASRLLSPAWRAAGGLFTQKSSAATKLHAKAATHYRDFQALNGISFEIKKGESIGIIGRNGSGKSTLLQIIAGTLQPTTGFVKINGRVAALLELGSGFNPEFSGRENVYLNGAILGLSRSEIDARFEDIAAFADIGEFIEQPVKTYSSGMMIRLAFAAAVSIEPEVLIVDEALSVGDVFFQQKCFKRVHEMLDRGTSLLFVSHDTAAVQNLCDRAILLVKGDQVFSGPPEEAVSRYFALASPAVGGSSHLPRDLTKNPAGESIRAVLGIYNMRTEARSEHGQKDLIVDQVALLNSRQEPARNFVVGETMHLWVLLRATGVISNPSSGLHFYDRMNNLVFAAGTRQLLVPFGDFAAGETRIIEFQLELSVLPGEYTFSVGCAQASDEGPNQGYIQHRLEGLGPITVLPPTTETGTWPFYGIAKLPLNIKVHG